MPRNRGPQRRSSLVVCQGLALSTTKRGPRGRGRKIESRNAFLMARFASQEGMSNWSQMPEAVVLRTRELE